MRHSFTLQLEYGGALRGNEKQELKKAIETLSIVQGMYTFGYEDEAFGRYAFFAVPSVVERHKDYLEVSTFKTLLGQWLDHHPRVERFESSQLFELSEIKQKSSAITPSHQASNSNRLRLRS